MNPSVSLTVRREIALSDTRVTLLDLLREQLEPTATKKGCDRGQCGGPAAFLSMAEGSIRVWR